MDLQITDYHIYYTGKQLKGCHAGLDPASSFPLEFRMNKSIWYILASARNGTLYVGVTSDLLKRVWEHKNDVVEGFTKRA